MSSPPAGPAEPLPSLPPPVLPPAGPQLPKSPVLALILSFLFPGIGQVYNGQPAKAIFFFFAFVGSIYAVIEIDPIPFGLFIPFVVFYNLVDAWRSASLINARYLGGQPVEEEVFESPAWGGALVGLGLVLLLHNLGWLRLAALGRYWPLLMIAAGGIFLFASLRRRKAAGADGVERGNGPVL